MCKSIILFPLFLFIISISITFIHCQNSSKDTRYDTQSDILPEIEINDSIFSFDVFSKENWADVTPDILPESCSNNLSSWASENNPVTLGEPYSISLHFPYLYIAGTDIVLGKNIGRIEKRSSCDGSFIWSQQVNTASVLRDIKTDDHGLYILGLYSDSNDLSTMGTLFEKRDLVNGTILWSQFISQNGPLVEARNMAVDSTGIYIVGADTSGKYAVWRIEKRSSDNGSILWEQSNNIYPNGGGAWDIAINSEFLYVVGTDYSKDKCQWRIEKRQTNNGATVWIQINDYSNSDDEAMGVAVDSTGVYIIGNDNSPGNKQWRIEKRNLLDGKLIWTQSNNYSGNYDIPWGLTIDNTGIYIAGMDQSLGWYQWRIEKRNLNDGNLNWTISNSIHGVALDIIVNTLYIYLIGGEYSEIEHHWRIEKRSKFTDDL